MLCSASVAIMKIAGTHHLMLCTAYLTIMKIAGTHHLMLCAYWAITKIAGTRLKMLRSLICLYSSGIARKEYVQCDIL